jgi:hypothetical protein
MNPGLDDTTFLVAVAIFLAPTPRASSPAEVVAVNGGIHFV